MTATDRVRAMLDERGVEWDELAGHPVVVGTEWHDRDGHPCTALEHADDVPDGMLSVQACLTPEQAIEATLGRGECKKLPSDGITRCFVRRYGYEIEFGYWKCSACGCECFEGARYCMGCGRKVRA